MLCHLVNSIGPLKSWRLGRFPCGSSTDALLGIGEALSLNRDRKEVALNSHSPLFSLLKTQAVSVGHLPDT